MSGNRRRRLEKLEQKLADLARQEALANCICNRFTAANSPKIFEAEMNRVCPAHGVRRLGLIFIPRIGPKRENDVEQALIHALVDEYKRRLAQAAEDEDERNYGCQEL